MKPVNQEDAKKLDLQKKTVAVLSSDDQKSIDGGQNAEAITTSWGPCTGFTCCPPATVDPEQNA
jgi:hypothetical protein